MNTIRSIVPTDIGPLPEDWAVCPIGSALSGLPAYGLNAAATAFKPASHRYLRITDINDEGRLGDVEPVSVNGWVSERYLVGHGDILIARTGASTGKSYLWNPNDGTMVFAGYLLRLKPDQTKLHPSFAAAHLRTARYWSYVASVSQRSGQPGINGAQLSQYLIPIPKLEEQAAIAQALSDMDDLIASLNALIAKKRDIKQGAMQQLLTGKRRLPGFSGEWQSKQLGELFELTMARSKAQFIEKGGRFWIVDMGSVTRSGKLSVSKSTNVDNDVLNRGDLLMPKDDIGGGNIIGRVGYIDQDEKYVCGDHVYRLRCRNGMSLFYYFLINSDPINSMLRKHVVGSAQLGLGRKSVLNQPLWFPRLAEQSAIAEVLADMDDDLVALEDKREKIRGLKQSMMQQLLTGRIRLI